MGHRPSVGQLDGDDGGALADGIVGPDVDERTRRGDFGIDGRGVVKWSRRGLAVNATAMPWVMLNFASSPVRGSPCR